MNAPLYTYKLYTVTAMTNLHPGSGDANYGVVDNLIQRDPVDEIPVIHSSSIKGALREFLKYKELAKNPGQPTAGDKMITALFGSSTDDQKEVRAGTLRFLESFLIGLPVRASDRPFYIAVAPVVAQRLLDMNVLLEMKLDESKLMKVAAFNENGIFVHQESQIRIEDEVAQPLANQEIIDALEVFKPMFGDMPIALMDDTHFKEMCRDLPVIARNQLENGISKNLFYEQVLPRQSRLALLIGFPSSEILHKEDKQDFESWTNTFVSHILADTPQIGANASIGYGICKIEEAACQKK